jgi:hypothetical protein
MLERSSLDGVPSTRRIVWVWEARGKRSDAPMLPSKAMWSALQASPCSAVEAGVHALRLLQMVQGLWHR